MEIVKAVLVQILRECKEASQLPELGIIIENIAKARCTIALQDMRDILHNSDLDDTAKVSEAMRILEQFEAGRHRMPD